MVYLASGQEGEGRNPALQLRAALSLAGREVCGTAGGGTPWELRASLPDSEAWLEEAQLQPHPSQPGLTHSCSQRGPSSPQLPCS